MADGANNNILLKWVMGIISTILVAAVIGLWTKVDMLQVQVATSQAERVTLRRDMDELKESTKEILVIVTDIRIQVASSIP